MIIIMIVCVRVCVCACVRACVRVCVCVYVRLELSLGTIFCALKILVFFFFFFFFFFLSSSSSSSSSFRTDNARDRLPLPVRGAGQTAAPVDDDEQEISVATENIIVTRFSRFFQTHVLCGCQIEVVCSQVSAVLGRPSRWTGEGTGYHDGGRLGGSAHCAVDGVIVILALSPVLGADDVTEGQGHIVIKLRR